MILSRLIRKSAKLRLKKCCFILSISINSLLFSLFETRIASEKKKKIADNLINAQPIFRNENHEVKIKPEDIPTLELDQLVCAESLKFFEITKVDTTFLEDPVRTWKYDMNRNFQKAASDICALSVVNDPAKRAVALVKFLKCYNFKPKDNDKFQAQIITVGAEKNRNQMTQKDEELLQWYLDQPTLDYDETSDCEE